MSVIGFGDPVLDIISHVSYDTLSSLSMEAGGCDAVNLQELEHLLNIPKIQQNISRHPGGSAANVCKGLAGLATTPTTVSFIGMIGSDPAGQEYKHGLSQCGVTPLLSVSTTDAASATASCLCLVTPDGQRTMRTYLGAALELNKPGQLPPQLTQPHTTSTTSDDSTTSSDNITNSNGGGLALLHCEGYALYRKAVTAAALRAARTAGAKTSIDLASFEVIRGCWETLREVLNEGLIDIVFCNEDEASAVCEMISTSTIEVDNGTTTTTRITTNGTDMTTATKNTDSGVESNSTIDTAMTFLLQHCNTVVISRGKAGCIAGNKMGSRASSPASSVDVIDTVGAGDHFTAGFLHAWLQGASLEVCTAVGCASGTAAVQCVGANIDSERRSRLKEQVSEIMKSGGVSGSGKSTPEVVLAAC